MLLDARTALAETLAPSTVNDYFSVISQIFTKAVREWQWLQVSPLQYLSKLKEPRGRVRYLSEDELTRLLGACRESRSPHLFLVVIFALSTGARRNELLSLTWADIDFTRVLITFRETKNGEDRSVPLSQHALVHMRQHAAGSSSPYVFPRAQGGACSVPVG
jgi:integrase